MFLSWLHWELGDAKRGRDYALEGLAASVQLPDHAQGPLMVDTVGAHCSLLDIGGRVPSFGRERPRVLNAEAERALAFIEQWLARKSWWHWLLRSRVDAYRSQRALALGDVASAELHARALLERASHYQSRRLVAIARSLLAEVEAELGRPEQALAELLTAVTLADELAMPLLGWKLQVGLGRLYRLLDKQDEARQAYARALELVRSIAGEIDDEASRGLLLESELVREAQSGACQLA
jgi:tetratricopeptide (TPR) repeat protein